MGFDLIHDLKGPFTFSFDICFAFLTLSTFKASQNLRVKIEEVEWEDCVGTLAVNRDLIFVEAIALE
ncbi:hypothetical protein F0562_007494 [Nyssa sinensis]|uniref:Uncharacterized protein n=1 Tax=Nyssa sinensis TaxID=561372 RepID=A0A5J5A5Z2_9ASTE|nr:hypothetical protein F0562_007494 [Nyssa sinensis]